MHRLLAFACLCLTAALAGGGPLAAGLDAARHAAPVAARHAEPAAPAGVERDRQRELVAAVAVLGAALVATGLLVALLIGAVRRSNALARQARAAEAAARVSEARLAGILENSTDWIWETDAAGRFSHYAPSAIADAADQPPIAPGAVFEDLRAPADDDDAGWRRQAERMAARLPFRDFVFAYPSRAGALRWARVHGRPVFDADGAFAGYRGTGRDITAEREAEQAVSEGRALLRAVIDAIPALVNVKDAEGRYVLMNRFQAEVYGTAPEAAVGRVSADFTGPDYGGESLRLDREVIESGTGGPFYERTFVDAAGRRRVWWTAKQPLAGPDGTVRHVLTVAMDITGLKDAERARTNLSRYFSPNMVALLSERDEPLGQVRAQQVAVIFADLFDFTRFSAQHAPEEVMATLRDLHGRLTDIVLAHGGTLEKFLGDGIMATFGTPLPTGTDATRALAAARDMVAMIGGWNAGRAAAGRARLSLGIGAHLGPVLLGEVGSARRVEYAVVGGTVNLASRLQDMTRALRTPAVVSRDLLDAARAEGAEGARLAGLFEAVAPQPVDGFDDPVEVAVLAPAENAPDGERSAA